MTCVAVSLQRSSEWGSYTLAHQRREGWGRQGWELVRWLTCCPPLSSEREREGERGGEGGKD